MIGTEKVNASGFTDSEEKILRDGGDMPANDAGVSNDNETAGDGGTGESTTPVPTGQPPAQSKPPAGYVEKEALHEARAKLKAAEERANGYERTFQQFMARFNQPQQQQPQPKIPDKIEDPVGYLEAHLAMTRQQLAYLTQNQQQRQQMDEQTARSQQVVDAYAHSVRAYKREAPDWDDAFQFLSDARDKELQALGFSDPVERANRLQYDEGMILGHAFHNKLDPAKVLYDAAVARGYVKKGASPANDNKLQTIAKGQQKAATLQGESPNAEGEMTLARLHELQKSDPKAADKLWERMKRSGKL